MTSYAHTLNTARDVAQNALNAVRNFIRVLFDSADSSADVLKLIRIDDCKNFLDAFCLTPIKHHHTMGYSISVVDDAWLSVNRT